MSSTTNRTSVRFAAINPSLDGILVTSDEHPVRGGDYVSWGGQNNYPDYLLDLYGRVATLRSIINGCTDFVAGNAVEIAADSLPLPAGAVNLQGMTDDELVRLLGLDYYLYGGFAIEVIRDLGGRVVELYHLDMRYLRTNAERDAFYYCEDWSKKKKVDVYPAFMPSASHAASIIYVANTYTRTYPEPLYGASLKACETEAAIGTFHLRNINNDFVGSLFVNFNNGNPADEVKEEIERNFCRKFTGADNAGRVGFSWNDNVESATTFETFSIEDFGARYDALAKYCRQEIFTAFRAQPILFGIPTESSLIGAQQNFEEAFRLFNRTQIRPVQNIIRAAVGKAVGNPDALTIVPFTIE